LRGSLFQLTEELRTKRHEMETHVATVRQELETLREEKQEMTLELREMKEQLQFIMLKKKIEIVSTGNSAIDSHANSSAIEPVVEDKTLKLELHRVEQALVMMNATLSSSRVELTQLQDQLCSKRSKHSKRSCTKHRIMYNGWKRLCEEEMRR
jgi:predicted  nucleic acid-binding Zn-ribbon protein